jgi:hypothetical protein
MELKPVCRVTVGSQVAMESRIMAERMAHGGTSKSSNEFADKAAQQFDKVTDQVENIAR